MGEPVYGIVDAEPCQGLEGFILDRSKFAVIFSWGEFF
jgi:hypothetical protein